MNVKQIARPGFVNKCHCTYEGSLKNGEEGRRPMHGVGTLTVVPDKSEQDQKFTEVYTGSWDNNNFIEGTIAFSNQNHGEMTISIERPLACYVNRKDVKQVHIEFQNAAFTGKISFSKEGLVNLAQFSLDGYIVYKGKMMATQYNTKHFPFFDANKKPLNKFKS